MLKAPEEIEVGQTVYLVPYTKTASANCHRKLAVEVAENPKKHWPRILVHWTEPDGGHWEMVFKDNIRIKRPEDAKVKGEGDSTQDHEVAFAQVRKIRRVLKPIALPPDMEEGTLF